MRAVLLGRKPVACAALAHMLERGVDVVAAVAPPSGAEPHYGRQLSEAAAAASIPVLPEAALYEAITEARGGRSALGDVDVVFSLMHQSRVRRPLLELPTRGCVNFHPAPLPDFRGWGGYNTAILEGVSTWGATAHFMDEDFDTGAVIRQESFSIDPRCETAFTLERRTQVALLSLFRCVVDDLLRGSALPAVPQGFGRRLLKREVMLRREILPTDDRETIDRKVRAFWFPPYPGAFVRGPDGGELLVVNERLLQDFGEAIHGYLKFDETDRR